MKANFISYNSILIFGLNFKFYSNLNIDDSKNNFLFFKQLLRNWCKYYYFH